MYKLLTGIVPLMDKGVTAVRCVPTTSECVFSLLLKEMKPQRWIHKFSFPDMFVQFRYITYIDTDYPDFALCMFD